MRLDGKSLELYGVTDRSWLGENSLLDQVEQALKGGVTCIQLREKGLSEEDFLAEAIAMKALCNRYQVPFFINDNVDIAVKSGADGVHVGQSDLNAGKVREKIGETILIGVSAQTVDQALLAQQQGADYLGVGAVFSTSTKLDANQVSHEILEEIARKVDIPVVAIGGISGENMLQLQGRGLAGVAVVSAIFASEDIVSACEALRKKTKQVVN